MKFFKIKMPLPQNQRRPNGTVLTLAQPYGAKPLTCLHEQMISTRLNVI